MKPYDFKTSGYFPFHVLLVGIGLIPVGLAMLTMDMLIGGPILLLISLIILTTRYGCTIDFEKKQYHDYVWILGMKSGEKKSFDDIQYVFIKPSQVSQTMGLRAANTTLRKSVFDGYLKFSETNKLHLLTKDSKDDLIQKLQPIATSLDVEIFDFSDGGAKIVSKSK